MGLILCKKHGAQGIVINIQEELVSKIYSGSDIDTNELEIIEETLSMKDESFEDFRLKYLVTKGFIKENDLKLHYRNTNEETHSWIRDTIGSKMGIVCGECMNDYVKSHDLIRSKFSEFL